jgi:hypothetical protein
MEVWIRLPGQIPAESRIPIYRCSDYPDTTGRLSLYFSAENELILADILEVPELSGLEFQKLSGSDGISLQLNCKEAFDRKPVMAYLIGSDSDFTAGQVHSGLLSGIWMLRFPGPLPSSAFRITIEWE